MPNRSDSFPYTAVPMEKVNIKAVFTQFVLAGGLKRGFSDFDMYYNGIQKDKALLEEFVDRITINVSEFYRNPARWKVLEQNVIPELIKEKKVLHIWSAACSTGEEPYSLLMLFQDHFPGIKVKITATDIDEKILKRAQQGIYKPQ